MKYMIAVDGSEPAKRALEMAAALMKEDDSLLVLSVGEWEPHKFPILFDSDKGIARSMAPGRSTHEAGYQRRRRRRSFTRSASIWLQNTWLLQRLRE